MIISLRNLFKSASLSTVSEGKIQDLWARLKQSMPGMRDEIVDTQSICVKPWPTRAPRPGDTEDDFDQAIGSPAPRLISVVESIHAAADASEDALCDAERECLKRLEREHENMVRIIRNRFKRLHEDKPLEDALGADEAIPDKCHPNPHNEDWTFHARCFSFAALVTGDPTGNCHIKNSAGKIVTRSGKGAACLFENLWKKKGYGSDWYKKVRIDPDKLPASLLALDPRYRDRWLERVHCERIHASNTNDLALALTPRRRSEADLATKLAAVDLSCFSKTSLSEASGNTAGVSDEDVDQGI